MFDLGPELVRAEPEKTKRRAMAPANGSHSKHEKSAFFADNERVAGPHTCPEFQRVRDRATADFERSQKRAMIFSAFGRSAAPIATLMMSATTNGATPAVNAVRASVSAASHDQPPR